MFIFKNYLDHQQLFIEEAYRSHFARQ